MRVQNVVRNKNNHLSFEINDVDASVVNALRRSIWSNVKNVAFYFDVRNMKDSDITVLKNTSPIHNEFLSQRISMCPIHFTKDEIEQHDKLKYKFVLKKKNTTSHIVDVTTDDFTIIDTTTGETMPDSFVKRVLPRDSFTNDPIPITILKPNLTHPQNGGEVDIECYASIGTKEKHTCYSAVSNAVHWNVVDKTKADKAFEKIFNRKDASGSRMYKQSDRTTMRKEFDTLDVQRYFYTNVHGEPSRFGFSIESECAITPDEMITIAFDYMLRCLTDIEEDVQGTKSNQENMVSIAQDKTTGMTAVSIEGHSHTIGNLLQSLMYNTYLRDTVDEKHKLVYIGYNCPHPLHKQVVLKIKFKNDHDENDVKEFMIVAMKTIYELIKEIKEDVLRSLRQ